jgi:hypothetical protein
MQISVKLEINAVRFHPLNSFEWAVLSGLSAFPDNPPSLAEVSEQFRLHEPAFLTTALETMCRDQAIERGSASGTRSPRRTPRSMARVELRR